MSVYTYSEPASVRLSVIKTSPNAIILKRIDKNVAKGTDYGINGGFYDFASRVQLSIAINNDTPVAGIKGIHGYGSGWFNEKYARGTLVWDAVARRFSIPVVKNAGEIEVLDRNKYWAQGGISMTLQDDKAWSGIAHQQNMPNMSGLTQRSALLYNTGLNVWLVISEGACSASAFRSRIKESIGSGTLVDGIFLDGGGSTQMLCKENKFAGDGRSVVQMVAIRQ